MYGMILSLWLFSPSAFILDYARHIPFNMGGTRDSLHPSAWKRQNWMRFFPCGAQHIHKSPRKNTCSVIICCIVVKFCVIVCCLACTLTCPKNSSICSFGAFTRPLKETTNRAFERIDVYRRCWTFAGRSDVGVEAPTLVWKIWLFIVLASVCLSIENDRAPDSVRHDLMAEPFDSKFEVAVKHVWTK